MNSKSKLNTKTISLKYDDNVKNVSRLLLYHRGFIIIVCSVFIIETLVQITFDSSVFFFFFLCCNTRSTKYLFDKKLMYSYHSLRLKMIRIIKEIIYAVTLLDSMLFYAIVSSWCLNQQRKTFLNNSDVPGV